MEESARNVYNSHVLLMGEEEETVVVVVAVVLSLLLLSRVTNAVDTGTPVLLLVLVLVLLLVVVVVVTSVKVTPIFPSLVVVFVGRLGVTITRFVFLLLLPV